MVLPQHNSNSSIPKACRGRRARAGSQSLEFRCVQRREEEDGSIGVGCAASFHRVFPEPRRDDVIQLDSAAHPAIEPNTTPVPSTPT
jgi:hypothetical protein